MLPEGVLFTEENAGFRIITIAWGFPIQTETKCVRVDRQNITTITRISKEKYKSQNSSSGHNKNYKTTSVEKYCKYKSRARGKPKYLIVSQNIPRTLYQNNSNASSIIPIGIFFNFNRNRKKSPQANKSINKHGKPGTHHFPLVIKTGTARNSPYSKAAVVFFIVRREAKGKGNYRTSI